MIIEDGKIEATGENQWRIYSLKKLVIGHSIGQITFIYGRMSNKAKDKNKNVLKTKKPFSNSMEKSFSLAQYCFHSTSTTYPFSGTQHNFIIRQKKAPIS